MDRSVFEYLKDKFSAAGQKAKGLFVPCSSQARDKAKSENIKNVLLRTSCIFAAVLTLSAATSFENVKNNKFVENNTTTPPSVNAFGTMPSQTLPTYSTTVTPETDEFVAPPEMPTNTKMNVWTYNLLRAGIDTQHGKVHEWATRKNYVTSQILNANPDIVGFQEVSTSMNDFLAGELQDYSVTYYSKNNPNASSQAIYYKSDRFELLDSGMFYLSETPEQESKSFGTDVRNCVWVKLKDKKDNTMFYVYNIHYTHKAADKEARRLSSELINSVTEGLDAPVILLGDFNARSNEAAYKTLAEQYIDSLHSAENIIDSGNTYHGFNQSKYSNISAIDHIWLSTTNGESDFVVNSYEVVDDYTEGFINKFGNIAPTEAEFPIAPSDHYPVSVEVMLNYNDSSQVIASSSETISGYER